MNGSWTSYRLISPWDPEMVIVFYVEGDSVTIRYFYRGDESPEWTCEDTLVTPDRRFGRDEARRLWRSKLAHGWEYR